MHGDGLSFKTAPFTGKWVNVYARGRSIIRTSNRKSRRRRAHSEDTITMDDGSGLDTNVSYDDRRRGREVEKQIYDFEKNLLNIV